MSSKPIRLSRKGLVTKRKREGLYLLPVPLVEALELPLVVERTKQKPHAVYVYDIPKHASAFKNGSYISTRHLPLSHSRLLIEVFQVSTSQERAFDKRFHHYVCISLPTPLNMWCQRYAPQIYKFIPKATNFLRTIF